MSPSYETVEVGLSKRDQFAASNRDRFAAASSSGQSLMSMGCSGHSLLSMDLGLRSQDFEGGYGSLINSGDFDYDADDDLHPEFKTSQDSPLPDINAGNGMTTSEYEEPLASLPEDQEHKPCPVVKLTADLERCSTSESVDPHLHLLNEKFRVTSGDWGMPVPQSEQPLSNIKNYLPVMDWRNDIPRALLDEQRLLYEQIMTEKAANDAAIARANADAFDMKSSTFAARAMPGGEESLAARTDAVGKNGTGGVGTSSSSTGRMVKIGNNQMVALHGQDRTKKAIKEGTAILVQCINCQNWMQVTDTASLMFCPVCQVVSPVIKQSKVLTKEEAIQLTMDRKLAEKLQAEYNNRDIEDDAEEEGGGKSADDEGYLARFFGSGASKYPAARSKSSPKAHQTEGTDSSWWDKITSIVSYGVADEGPKERGELGVTRPPGTASRQRLGAESSSSAASSPVAVHDRVAGRDEETTGLLSPVVVDGNEANLPAARVAEQRPLFSCVMDSVSSATSALWSTTGEGDREGNVYGVDASSLLVTNAGRDVGDGAGDYAQLSNRE